MVSILSKCPLCQGSLKCLDSLSVKDLSLLYLKKYNMNIKMLFGDALSLTYVQCKNCGLKFFNPIVTGDDEFYGLLEKENWYYLHDDKFEYIYSKRYINEKSNVLDVGSGRGVFSQYIHCGFYQGLDFSSKAIELAELDGTNVLSTSIEKHCVDKPEYYDVVVLFQVIEHVSDVESFIESSVKSLKPGGRLIIATPNNDGFMKDALNCDLNLPPHHVLHWNEQSLTVLADKFHMTIEDVCKEPVANIHKHWWYTTIINAYIHKFLHRKFHLVDLRFSSWFFHGLSHVIGWGLQLLNLHKRGSGQSIIMVYKKKQC